MGERTEDLGHKLLCMWLNVQYSDVCVIGLTERIQSKKEKKKEKKKNPGGVYVDIEKRSQIKVSSIRHRTQVEESSAR